MGAVGMTLWSLLRARPPALGVSLLLSVAFDACPSSPKESPASSTAEFFVASDGSAAGLGTRESPWDLETGTGGSREIAAGSTVWLRGGIYGLGGTWHVVTRLNGAPSAPISVRAFPGERVVIDGGIEAQGAWTSFVDLEITNRAPRTSPRAPGLNLLGRGHRAINLVVMGAGHPGIAVWRPVGDGGLVHGCILAANGDASPDGKPIEGSGLYIQNESGLLRITDNISFRNYTTGMKAYSAKSGPVRDITFEGNVVFDNNQWNLFVAGREQPAAGIVLRQNFSYKRRVALEQDARKGVQLGYYDVDMGDAVVEGNVFASGLRAPALLAKRFTSLKVMGNLFLGPVEMLELERSAAATDWRFAGNTYVSEQLRAFLVDGKALTDAEWVGASLEADARFGGAAVVQPLVYVRKNEFEPGRSHVIIYNFGYSSDVEVDLRSVARPGVATTVHDPQDWFGPPVWAGSLPANGRIRLPLRPRVVPPLPGQPEPFPHSAPEFMVFVVRQPMPRP